MTYKFQSKDDYIQKSQLAKTSLGDFWSIIADQYSWQKKWDQVYSCDYQNANFKWFRNAKLNITENCLDRHLQTNADKTAIIFEHNDINKPSEKITYKELYERVNQYANLYKKYGLKKGDRICIYMPMMIESVAACLACAKIGAIHSVVFAGFSAKSLESRIKDCEAKLVITSDYTYRGAKKINLIDIVREATKQTESIENIFIFAREESQTKDKRELIINDEIDQSARTAEIEIMDSEDPLFILYTSGSTGKPKGVVHSCAGYMTYAGYSFVNVFDYQDEDIFFCTADIGWITGHSYMMYGPLLAGSTIVMFEGIPTYPEADRFWQIIEKHNVTTFYTAPTAIRMLMKFGSDIPNKYQMESLRVIGSVGEPINEEAWKWFYENVGKTKCNLVDTWWQTETGGIMISNLAAFDNSKASFAGTPLPGIFPTLISEEGNEVKNANQSGYLCISTPWPSMIRSIWGDHTRCIGTYFNQFPGNYLCGDGALFDDSGNFRIIGRIDDVINSSGHRIGTAEIENAINMHPSVTESAVIGYPHSIKGEAIKAYVIAKNTNIKEEINAIIKEQIGSIAKPEEICFVADLPKTRSGKIMRRILKKISANNNDLGDISTLVNPEIIAKLRDIS
ncbi:MAG: acetate--CoA ligase [Rickettsiales bacterium]|jgi:acetyl-CoA synthetase|nr:acetate--CoA ligase [Rickettsiales bacterium]